MTSAAPVAGNFSPSGTTLDVSMPQDLADLTAVQMVEGFRSRVLSPVEVMEAVHRRLDTLEPMLHALWSADPEAAVEAAR